MASQRFLLQVKSRLVRRRAPEALGSDGSAVCRLCREQLSHGARPATVVLCSAFPASLAWRGARSTAYLLEIRGRGFTFRSESLKERRTKPTTGVDVSQAALQKQNPKPPPGPPLSAKQGTAQRKPLTPRPRPPYIQNHLEISTRNITKGNTSA